jgi:hypothetical protein
VSVISDEINECISLPHPFCSEQGPKKYNDIGIGIPKYLFERSEKGRIKG